MTYRIRNISIAIALALVAALLTSFYVTNYQRDVRKNETNVPVFVAKVDIPAGTSGADVVRSGMMNKTEIVRRGVVPGAISNPAQLATLVATEPIYAGEQVSTRRFATPSERGIRAQLTGVQRAIAIPGDAHQLLAGTLKDGDHIDVVASFSVPRGEHDALQPDHPARHLGSAGADAGGVTREGHLGQDGPFSATIAVTDTPGAEAALGDAERPSGTWSCAPRSRPRTARRTSRACYSLLREGVRPKQLEDARVGNAPVEGNQ